MSRARKLALLDRKIAPHNIVFIGLEKDMRLCLTVVCKIDILYSGIAARAVIGRYNIRVPSISIAVLHVGDR